MVLCLSSTILTEVFGGLWYDILEELHLDSPQGLTAEGDVEEYYRIGRCGCHVAWIEYLWLMPGCCRVEDNRVAAYLIPVCFVSIDCTVVEGGMNRWVCLHVVVFESFGFCGFFDIQHADAKPGQISWSLFSWL